MQIDLATAVAWDFARPSKPQPSETQLIWSIAQGDKRAMHVLFARHRSPSTVLRCAWSPTSRRPRTW